MTNVMHIFNIIICILRNHIRYLLFQSSQQTIFKNSKELQKTRDESRELQNSVCQLGQELQKTHHTLQVEQKQSAELHEQVSCVNLL